MEAVFLKAKGLRLREICDLVGVCPHTFRSWLRDFQSGGVAGLKRWESGGSTSELDAHADAICEYLTERPPHTVAEAARAIEELTGVRRSVTQVRDLLKRLGFLRLKTGSLPAKADPKAQSRFKKNSLSPG
jgi:transposase